MVLIELVKVLLINNKYTFSLTSRNDGAVVEVGVVGGGDCDIV